MSKAKKKKGGRPKLPEGRRQLAATTSLPPHLYRAVQELGGGSVYRGLQLAAERVAGQAAGGAQS